MLVEFVVLYLPIDYTRVYVNLLVIRISKKWAEEAAQLLRNLESDLKTEIQNNIGTKLNDLFSSGIAPTIAEDGVLVVYRPLINRTVF